MESNHSTISTSNRGGGIRKSYRSSFSCVSCHSAKIKCDASSRGVPCTRCRDRKLLDCELLESQRRSPERRELIRRQHRLAQSNPTFLDANLRAMRDPSVINGLIYGPSTQQTLSSTTSQLNYSTDSALQTDIAAKQADRSSTFPLYPGSSTGKAPASNSSRVKGFRLLPDSVSYNMSNNCHMCPQLNANTMMLDIPGTGELSSGLSSIVSDLALVPPPPSDLTRKIAAVDRNPSDLLQSLSDSSNQISKKCNPIWLYEKPSDRFVNDGLESPYRLQWSILFTNYLNREIETKDASSCGESTDFFGNSFPTMKSLRRHLRIDAYEEDGLRSQKRKARQLPLKFSYLAHEVGTQVEFDQEMEEGDSRPFDEFKIVSDHNLAHMTEAQITYLKSKDCFTLPVAETREALIVTYYARVHNLYPVLQKKEFERLYGEGRVSLILMHAMCFAAARHCELKVLCRDGFITRREARRSYYDRAKTLFDMDYERKQITIVQCSILLSLWGGQSTTFSGLPSWLHVAMNVAESMGMYSSARLDIIRAEERCWWKRVWWCLCTQDSFNAAMRGKPLRIRMDQCSVEEIDKSDFPLVDEGFEKVQTEYVIEQSKLGSILRGIISIPRRYRDKREFVDEIRHKLEEWRAELSRELDLDGGCLTSESPGYLYAVALRLTYCHHQIYLYQVTLPNAILPRAVAWEASMQITDLASELVTTSAIRHLPEHAFASLQMAVVMLFTQSRNGEARILIRSQVEMCEMIMMHVREYWEHADWILELCEQARRAIDEEKEEVQDAKGKEDRKLWDYKDFTQLLMQRRRG